MGFAYASTRVANADRSLNTVISHQNNLNSTFKDIDTQFNGLSSNSTFNPKESRTVIEKFVTNAKAAVTMVDRDDASLSAASGGLATQQWLTTLSRSGSGDFAAAKAGLPKLKTDLDKALQLSTAPGLPGEVHSLMVDLATLVADYGKLLDALAANDNAAIVTAGKSVEADGTKIGAYDFTKIGTDLSAYYKPRVDAFNSEMAKTTAAYRRALIRRAQTRRAGRRAATPARSAPQGK